MPTPSGILRAYNVCLDETFRKLKRLSLNANYVRTKVTLHPDKSYVDVTLTEPMYFKEWPYKPLSKTRLDIVATVDETIKLETGKCTRSRCRINYFLIDGDKRIACDAIHFDFDSSIQSQHPICHAQNFNKAIEDLPNGLAELVDMTPLERRHQAIRIPTSFVNLAGLIQLLTADHLSPQHYASFWDSCETCVFEIPDHMEGAEVSAIMDSGSLSNRNWYKS